MLTFLVPHFFAHDEKTGRKGLIFEKMVRLVSSFQNILLAFVEISHAREAKVRGGANSFSRTCFCREKYIATAKNYAEKCWKVIDVRGGYT